MNIFKMIRVITPEEARIILSKNKDITILDVRTAKEFEKGHLEKAVNRNFYDEKFSEEIHQLGHEKKYLVYCHSGARALKTGEMMEKLGFDKVMVVKGNIASKND